VFHGFRGGKGAATLVGGLAVVWPQVLFPALLVWLLSMMWSGYVGLSTVLAGVSLVLVALVRDADGPRLALATIIAAFLVFTHRGNLARLRTGKEPRSERLRVLGRLLERKSS
jgi:glycerol-3-phosphate acyltransferase PlsY